MKRTKSQQRVFISFARLSFTFLLQAIVRKSDPRANELLASIETLTFPLPILMFHLFPIYTLPRLGACVSVRDQDVLPTDNPPSTYLRRAPLTRRTPWHDRCSAGGVGIRGWSRGGDQGQYLRNGGGSGGDDGGGGGGSIVRERKSDGERERERDGGSYGGGGGGGGGSQRRKEEGNDISLGLRHIYPKTTPLSFPRHSSNPFEIDQSPPRREFSSIDGAPSADIGSDAEIARIIITRLHYRLIKLSLIASVISFASLLDFEKKNLSSVIEIYFESS